AARVHTAARKPEQLRVDLLRGFYGSAAHKHDGVTAERMGNFIRSADACVTAWIRSNPMLRAAYPAGTPVEGMGIRSFGAAERQRYRAQNTIVVTFDDAKGVSAKAEPFHSFFSVFLLSCKALLLVSRET